MQTIEIDDEVFGRLKEAAEPFVDTPNSVLRRLLGLEAVASEPAVVGLTAQAAGHQNGAVTAKRTRVTRSGKKRSGKGRTRVPAGSILSEEEYELPLLEALVEAGGAAASKDVTEAVGKKLDHRLTDLDRERLASGAVRWENRIQFVRLKMIERGLMDRDAPRGTWAISESGRAFLKETEK